MKTRLISALIAMLIFIPILFIGGTLFNVAVYIISVLGLYEFIKIKEEKKELPSFIKFISYILLSLIILFSSSKAVLEFSIDYRILSGLFIMYLIPTILYHDRKIYSVNDAFYMLGGLIFIAASFSLLISIREKSLLLLIYLFLISIMTDTYAYITGMLIGKHKMISEISPKKTWEGMIGGTVVGVFIATLFYHNFIDNSLQLYILIMITLFLSILGQFGDLTFSAIKRYFNKKDFSNIMPGHGGVLDRFDIIYNVRIYIFYINHLEKRKNDDNNIFYSYTWWNSFFS